MAGVQQKGKFMDGMKQALENAGIKEEDLKIPLKSQPSNNGKNGQRAAAPVVSAGIKLRASRTRRKILLPQTAQEQSTTLAKFYADVAEDTQFIEEAVKWIRWYYQQSEEQKALYQSGNGEFAGYTEIQEELDTLLSEPNWAYRRMAVIAYAKAMIEICPESREWFRYTAGELVDVYFLICLLEDSKTESLRMFGEAYDLHPSLKDQAGLPKLPGGLPQSQVVTNEQESLPTAKRVWNMFQDLFGRTLEAEKKLREARAKSIQASAGTPITRTDLKEGKPGRMILQVPDLKRPERFNTLLVESDGNKVWPVQSMGAVWFEGKVKEVIEDEDCVLVKDLANPQQSRGLARTLHYWIANAIEAAEKRERFEAGAAERKAKAQLEFQKKIEEYNAQYEAERQALRPLANLTESEFFFDRKPGTTFCEYQLKFFLEKRGKEEAKRVYAVMALVERNEAGLIRVANRPERLKEFFADYREFTAEGDKFGNLGKLGKLLRDGYGRALVALSDEEKRKYGFRVQKQEQEQPSSEQSDTFVQTMMEGTGEDPAAVTVPVSPEEAEQAAE